MAARRPDQPGTPIMVRMQPEQLRLLDQWIAQHRPASSRPEALRQLVNERLGQMTHVRFVEGTFEDGLVIHDTVMDSAPPVGAIMEFTIDRIEAERFEVTGWKYCFEINTKALGLSDDLRSILVKMKRC